MELSWYSRILELWAGIGRAVNNITAAVIAGFVLQLLSSDNNLLKIISYTCIICSGKYYISGIYI
jgi:hypothetical protein